MESTTPSRQNHHSWLTRHDLFGYRTSDHLNLDRAESQHKTCLGGCTSLFVKLLFLAFVALKASLFFSREKDTSRTDSLPTDFENLAPIKYLDSGLQLFL